MKVLLVFLLCVYGAMSAPLWGPVGHEVTASVAQSLLNTAATNGANNILSGATLASVSTWADQIKNEPQWAWSYNLHFINTPDWACDFIPSRDCADEVCVADAIYNYTDRLQTQTDPEQILEALKFLTHFVGDIHQPLHCGFLSDKGGNTITGTFFGHNDNLHQIWDTWIIYQHMQNDFSGSQDQYVQYLEQQIQGPWASNAQQWATCANNSALVCPDEWGNESAGLACQYAYVDSNGNKITTPFDLGQDYYDFTSPIVDQQLAKGGVRLAMTLNNVFGGPSRALHWLNQVLPSNKKQ